MDKNGGGPFRAGLLTIGTVRKAHLDIAKIIPPARVLSLSLNFEIGIASESNFKTVWSVRGRNIKMVFGLTCGQDR